MGAVEDYLSYYGAHQWQQLRTVFDHSDFKRTGYADLFTDADGQRDGRAAEQFLPCENGVVLSQCGDCLLRLPPACLTRKLRDRFRFL